MKPTPNIKIHLLQKSHLGHMISTGGGGDGACGSVSPSVRAELSTGNGILLTDIEILFSCTDVVFFSGDEGAGGKLIVVAGLSIATAK